MKNRPKLSLLILIFLFSGKLAFASPATPEYEKGITLFENQQYAEAEVVFTDLVRMPLYQAGAAHYLGRISYHFCEYDTAITWLKKAADLDSTNAENFLWLARSYIKKGLNASIFKRPFHAKKARSYYQKGLAVDPENAYVRHDLIQYYMHVPGLLGGGKDKALAEAALLASENPWEGFKAYGTVYTLDKKYALAEENYLNALAAYPNDFQFYLLLAGLYQQMKDTEKALSVYRQAVKAAPDHYSEIYYNKGLLLLATKQYEDAFSAFEMIIRNDPNHMSAYYQLGYTAFAWGNRLDVAETCLTIYLRNQPNTCDPTLVSAHYYLGKIYDYLGSPAKAVQEYQSALAINPGYDPARKALKTSRKP